MTTADAKGDMTDAEAAEAIREWLVAPPVSGFAWPTDACGYRQHIRFANHRNANWHGGSTEEWFAFVRAYADSLAPEVTPPEVPAAARESEALKAWQAFLHDEFAESTDVSPGEHNRRMEAISSALASAAAKDGEIERLKRSVADERECARLATADLAARLASARASPATRRDDGTFYAGEQGPPPAPTRGETETSAAQRVAIDAGALIRHAAWACTTAEGGEYAEEQLATFASRGRNLLAVIGTNVNAMSYDDATKEDVRNAERDIEAAMAQMRSLFNSLDGGADGRGK